MYGQYVESRLWVTPFNFGSSASVSLVRMLNPLPRLPRSTAVSYSIDSTINADTMSPFYVFGGTVPRDNPRLWVVWLTTTGRIEAYMPPTLTIRISAHHVDIRRSH
jgi:hypothetical protein